MSEVKTPGRPRTSTKPRALPMAGGEVRAWEQIAAGRYMPRRTRGSFPGRELG